LEIIGVETLKAKCGNNWYFVLGQAYPMPRGLR
jgi:hypothetical protein